MDVSGILGDAASSMAAGRENKSAIGKLEDLIDDFNKPGSVYDEKVNEN